MQNEFDTPELVFPRKHALARAVSCMRVTGQLTHLLQGSDQIQEYIQSYTVRGSVQWWLFYIDFKTSKTEE